ncbi:MAG: dipicolinate synthase subunit B [Firmicutes bacterium]|nr:dipicolinate synthase subunit B [Bacillota bacterium]
MKKTVGIALTGSYCTFSEIFPAIGSLAEEYDLIPIVSQNVYTTDSRFITARETVLRLTELTGKPPIHTIAEAEPIGPKKLLDLLIIAPCTGNTLAKLAAGIADTPVTMAYKSHMRNSRPVLIGVSTNDGLAAAAANIARLINTKNVFFVPFGQDSPENKPTSLVCRFGEIKRAANAALEKKQIEPVIIGK